MPLPDVPPGGGSRGTGSNETSQTPPPPLPQQPSGNIILFYGQLFFMCVVFLTGDMF
jgi:hypothetical protein